MRPSNILLFLSRVALVCNIFFLLAASLQWKNYIGNNEVVSTIIVSGYFLAVFLFSPVVNIAYLVRSIARRDIFSIVPKWLVVCNFLFLLVQIIFIVFFLNDSFRY